MKLVADTNVLLRLLIEDDAQQAQTATAMLDQASLIAISMQTLCEIVWPSRVGRVIGASRPSLQ